MSRKGGGQKLKPIKQKEISLKPNKNTVRDKKFQLSEQKLYRNKKVRTGRVCVKTTRGGEGVKQQGRGGG